MQNFNKVPVEWNSFSSKIKIKTFRMDTPEHAVYKQLL